MAETLFGGAEAVREGFVERGTLLVGIKERGRWAALAASVIPPTSNDVPVVDGAGVKCAGRDRCDTSKRVRRAALTKGIIAPTGHYARVVEGAGVARSRIAVRVAARGNRHDRA